MSSRVRVLEVRVYVQDVIADSGLGCFRGMGGGFGVTEICGVAGLDCFGFSGGRDSVLWQLLQARLSVGHT